MGSGSAIFQGVSIVHLYLLHHWCADGDMPVAGVQRHSQHENLSRIVSSDVACRRGSTPCDIAFMRHHPRYSSVALQPHRRGEGQS